MELSITDRAARRIDEIREENKVEKEAYLRIGVVSGGCSGLTYELDFDTVGTLEKNDKLFNVGDLNILIDMRSFLYLAGTELDYTDGLEGKGFHFNNPNASRTCSCGESFSV